MLSNSMKSFLFILMTVTFTHCFSQIRDPQSKDRANVFWNGNYPLYSLTSDLEIKADSNGDYVFWGTTNESPSPTKYSLKKGRSLTVYKFITYDECVEFCNGIRKSRGLELLYNSSGNQSSNITKAQSPKEIEQYILKMKESKNTISNTYFKVDLGLNFDENQKKFADLIQSKKTGLKKIQKLQEDIRLYGFESEIKRMKDFYKFGMDNTVYISSNKSLKKAYKQKFISIEMDVVDVPPIWVISNNQPTLIYKQKKGIKYLISRKYSDNTKQGKKILKIVRKSKPLELGDKKLLIEKHTGLNDRFFELEQELLREQEMDKNLGLNNFKITDLGGLYCGEISNGELNGFGILFNTLGDTVFIGKWSGNFPDLFIGKLFQYQIQKNEVYLSNDTNIFISYSPSGDTYCGKKTSDNLRNGTGKYVWTNDNAYSGDWSEGERTGKGLFIWANGDQFQGDFKKEKITGLGKYYFTDGVIWEGSWVDNKFSGMGKKIAKDGSVFSEGLYEKGQLIKSKATLEQERIAEERRIEETRIANETIAQLKKQESYSQNVINNSAVPNLKLNNMDNATYTTYGNPKLILTKKGSSITVKWDGFFDVVTEKAKCGNVYEVKGGFFYGKTYEVKCTCSSDNSYFEIDVDSKTGDYHSIMYYNELGTNLWRTNDWIGLVFLHKVK